jgi:N-dimethylarginine dimethylaminohydrolase
MILTPHRLPLSPRIAPPLPDARADDELATESARNSRYMQMDAPFDAQRALAQHAALARALREGIPVVTFPGSADMPDAIFFQGVFATARDQDNG